MDAPAPPPRRSRRLRPHRALHWLLLAARGGSSDAYSASRPSCNTAKLHVPRDGCSSAYGCSCSSASVGRRAFVRQSSAALASVTASAAIRPPSALAAPSTPALGAPAPDFSLFNSRGQAVTLDALAANEKWTVLYFYPGAFTSGCTLEARRFQEDLPRYRELNAQVVGVSVDSVEKNAEFCNSEGLDFFMLTDEGGKVSKAYGSSLSIPGFGTFSNRQTYIIDPEKNVRWVFVDVESKIPKHSGEVLERLAQLQQAR